MGTLIHRDSTPERPLALAHYFFLEDLMGLLWLYYVLSFWLANSSTTEKSYSDKLTWQQERVAIRNHSEPRGIFWSPWPWGKGRERRRGNRKLTPIGAHACLFFLTGRADRRRFVGRRRRRSYSPAPLKIYVENFGRKVLCWQRRCSPKMAALGSCARYCLLHLFPVAS